MYRAGFNGNDVIVNAIRRGNRNIRFAFFLPLSLSLGEGQEKRCYLGRTREGKTRMDGRWCDARGAKQRVYVSPVTDRVNVGKDEEGLRFRGWTEGDGAPSATPSPLPLPRVGRGEGDRRWAEKKFLRPPRVRPCVTVCVARIFMRYITYSGK